ncbi:MAG: UPF0001 protein [Betaproteobacteria bacterium]|nr:Pyridoxal phosphate homeostasis protein [Rhodocyclaceae bacterium]
MTTIAERLQAVRARIAAAAHACGRDADEVTLVAVSKRQPLAAIEAAADCGQRHFGESYAQEGSDKIRELSGRGLIWHFVGPLQANKTRLVADHFDWVHSVDRLRIAERLSSARAPDHPPLQVLIQVKLSTEESKGGVSPEALPQLGEALSRLPHLRWRGLMTLPEADVELARARFAQLRRLMENLNARGFGLDTLSMGMSADLEAAIEEGAHLVRVGSAIFGERA